MISFKRIGWLETLNRLMWCESWVGLLFKSRFRFSCRRTFYWFVVKNKVQIEKRSRSMWPETLKIEKLFKNCSSFFSFSRFWFFTHLLFPCRACKFDIRFKPDNCSKLHFEKELLENQSHWCYKNGPTCMENRKNKEYTSYIRLPFRAGLTHCNARA